MSGELPTPASETTVAGSYGSRYRQVVRISWLCVHVVSAGDSLYVAGVSGLGAALPSANYMGAMAAILASGATPATQALAVVTFNVVAFTVAEVPLVSYLAAPRKTRAFMAALQSWLRSRSRRDAALLVAAGGCLMLTLGLSNL